MGHFDNLKYIDSRPFEGLEFVKWRADEILKGKTAGEMERATEQIDYAILVHTEKQIELDIDFLARQLFTEGGVELNHIKGYESGYSPTYSEIRDLIKNWPEGAAGEPYFFTPDLVPSFIAVKDTLESDAFCLSDQKLLFSKAQLYSVLALLRVDDAIRILNINKKRTYPDSSYFEREFPWDVESLIEAGTLAGEAMEAICWAELKLANDQLVMPRIEGKRNFSELDIVSHAEKERTIRSVNGTAMADQRWNKNRGVRDTAIDLIEDYLKKWDAAPNLYANQGDFSRDMEEKIGCHDDGTAVYAASTIQVKIIPRIRRRQYSIITMRA